MQQQIDDDNVDAVTDKLASLEFAAPTKDDAKVVEGDDVVRRLRKFCEIKGIATTGAIAMTIQRNRTGQYDSLIADLDHGTLHSVYPRAFDKTYREGPVAESETFLYCVQAGLDASPLRESTANLTQSDSTEVDSPAAFCCDGIVPYRPRRTANDGVFEKFVNGTGNAPGLLFEVKRQVDNGPLISTAVFELRDGVRLRVDSNESRVKVHSFKNFKCLCHNRFFGVDLFRTGGGLSRHHMRCNAFAKRDASLEDAFFQFHQCA